MGINQNYVLGLGPYYFHVHGRLIPRCGGILLEPQQQLVFTQHIYALDEFLQVQVQGNPQMHLHTMLTL